MSEVNCPVCGTPCKIVANSTIHYEPIAHSTLLAECEGLKKRWEEQLELNVLLDKERNILKSQLAKMREAVSEKIIKVLGFTKIGGKYLPDQWITEIAQVIAEKVEK